MSKQADGAPGRVNVLLSGEELRELDEWRRRQPDLPNRSEAVRRMIARVAKADAQTKRGARP
jgi:metal-responsive CopG/Arc/MetJ family transcriptional regulator